MSPDLEPPTRVAWGREVQRRAYDELRVSLREARSRSGLTQREVAERLGRPQSFVSKVENGERRLDPIELLVLLRVYRCSLKRVLPALGGGVGGDGGMGAHEGEVSEGVGTEAEAEVRCQAVTNAPQ